MDIQKITNGNGFADMLQMQKQLLEYYIVIEGLPKYPIDIHTKQGQKLINNFCNRFIQELSEGFFNLRNALEHIEQNSTGQAKLDIIAYNEEMADSLHFLLEILIYLGFDNEELDIRVEKALEHHGLENLYVTNDPLKSLFRLGKFLNSLENIPSYSNRFRIFNLEQLGSNPNYSGASRINSQTIAKHAEFLWEITFQINLAINYLKNKDWVQTENQVNEVAFMEKIVYIITLVFQYFDFAEITENGLGISYQIKNEINKQRIKNGY